MNARIFTMAYTNYLSQHNVHHVKARILTSLLVCVALYGCLLFSIHQSTFVSPVFGLEKTWQKKTSTASQAAIAKPSSTNVGASSWGYDFSKMANGPLTSSAWNFENGNKVANYNHEAQTYTTRQKNVRIDNGALVISAQREDLNGRHYTSARINTQGKFSFTYGTLEVDMMVPAGSGTWPAAWLLPENGIFQPSKYGISATDPFAWATNGEIDFAESIGSLPGQNIPAAHSYNEVHAAQTYTPAIVTNPYGTYHRYGVIKTPTSITFNLDGIAYASRHKTSNNPLDWPYDQPYYLILNLAIGGNWAGANGIDDSKSPWLLKVGNISYTPLQ
jgi:beta-glucanase (GH16 family)